jgi:UDP-N-acetylglucosamine--N-acetylmuramyl-(pentapeptide) pyrophosphoryl-undecaprenol N-acetylglucosamine transferase
MRVLIAAGGTGGHIYPGLAVAKEIMRRDPSSVVRFVGTARGLENRLVPQAGFELSLIESAGLVNMGLMQRLRGLLILPKSFLAARSIIKSFAPDAVVGVGGYVSGPVVMTASLMRVPTILVEPNAVPGFTNRRLAGSVDAAALSFEATLPYFPGKGVVTGNPVRREFFEIKPKPRDATSVSVLLFGGSQGSRAINDAMIDALPRLGEHRDQLQVTHQTGTGDLARVRTAYANAGWHEADVREYIDDMVSAFAANDLIISRAGATTSAELMAAGKAAIMIPLPGQLEQTRNAEALKKAGAARMIDQDELSGQRLADEIISLIDFPDEITQMEIAARKMSKRDAAEATVDLIEKVRRQKSDIRHQTSDVRRQI